MRARRKEEMVDIQLYRRIIFVMGGHTRAASSRWTHATYIYIICGLHFDSGGHQSDLGLSTTHRHIFTHKQHEALLQDEINGSVREKLRDCSAGV